MKNGTFSRVLKYIKGNVWLLLVTLVLALAIVAMTLYLPILIGEAIDLCIDGGVRLDLIKPILVKCGVIIALTALLQWVMSILNNNITFRIVRDIRRDAIRKIQRLPLSYIDSHQAGETVNRVISDVDQFSDGLLMGFTQFFTGIITIVGTLIFMLLLDWRIAIFVCALTPLSLFVAKFIAEHTHDFFVAQSKAKAEQTAFVNETVSEQKVSIAFSHGDENLERFNDINERGFAQGNLLFLAHKSIDKSCKQPCLLWCGTPWRLFLPWRLSYFNGWQPCGVPPLCKSVYQAV